MEETKICPHCGKSIKKAAKKCIHCKQWIDGQEHQGTERKVLDNNGSTSDKSQVVMIIIAISVLALGIIIYLLTKGDKAESDSIRTEYYDKSNSRDDDRSSSHYRSSSSDITEVCPYCSGDGEISNSECDFCGGYGKVKYHKGACERGCGCSLFVSRINGSTCLNCLYTFNCTATESEHEH